MKPKYTTPAEIVHLALCRYGETISVCDLEEHFCDAGEDSREDYRKQCEEGALQAVTSGWMTTSGGIFVVTPLGAIADAQMTRP